MPTLLETIGEYEQDILAAIAEAWGIDLEITAQKDSAKQITEIITEEKTITEMVDALGEESRNALKTIVMQGGRIVWDHFIREFGEIREMGPGRRERERPDRSPVSTTESLYYRAFIGRAFFDTERGLRESAFLPDEFHQFFKLLFQPSLPKSIPAVSDQLVAKMLLANDHIIDLATTVLAGLRTGLTQEDLIPFCPDYSVPFIISLLIEGKILSENLIPASDKVKQFLFAKRGQALSQLALIWLECQELDELDMLEKLEFEGNRKSNSKFSRTSTLALLNDLPEGQWFGIKEFTDWVMQNSPDLLRSGGEYDAWFVKNKETGNYISGFENWQQIDGYYLHIMIVRFFFWMGFVDLGKAQGNPRPDFFRKSKWFNSLMTGQNLEYPAIQKNTFDLEKTGKVIIDRYFPRDVRYQIARCCDWDIHRGNKFIYTLSPNALKKLEKQGLNVSQFITLINRYAKKPVPGNILTALARWEKNGKEASLTTINVLNVQSAAILDGLMATAAKTHILSRLNQTTAMISSESIPYLKAALLEMGIMAEFQPDI